MTGRRTYVGSHEEVVDCIYDIQISRTLAVMDRVRRERKEKLLKRLRGIRES